MAPPLSPYQQYQIPKDSISQLPRLAEKPLPPLPYALPPLPPSAPSASAPIPSPSSAIPSSIGDKINSGLSKTGNAAATLSAGLAVGSSIANAAQKQDANSLAQAAVTTASGALLLAPNPYAKAAGFALSLVGAPLANLLFPSKNNVSSAPITPLSGGQTIGVAYVLNVDYDVLKDGVKLYSVDDQKYGFVAPFRGISAPFGDGRNMYATLYDATGSRDISLAGGPGGLSIAGFSPTIERLDGQPDVSPSYQPLVANDGRPSTPPFDFDPDAIGDALQGLSDKLDGLSDGNKALMDALQGLSNPSASNPSAATPQAPNQAPSPSIAPPNSRVEPSPSTPSSPSTSGSAPRNGFLPPAPQKNDKLAPNTTPQAPTAPPNKDLQGQAKQLAEEQAAKEKAKTQTPTSPDRFKDPKDCKFSCSALAECFSDVKVRVFDGCNPDTGEAKTKEITVQALPKNKANVIATFAELLEIRSRECSLADRVQTTPEYWASRRGQIPQAIVLFKTTTKGENGEPSYYQLQIPHYNGGKNGKPSLPSYQKGEYMAIYECIDGSQMQVYASSDAEALRVINACEKYINPRMRMKDKKKIKTGKRGGMAKVTVKPIRLDFSSTGQAKLSPDWSIPL